MSNEIPQARSKRGSLRNDENEGLAASKESSVSQSAPARELMNNGIDKGMDKAADAVSKAGVKGKIAAAALKNKHVRDAVKNVAGDKLDEVETQFKDGLANQRPQADSTKAALAAGKAALKDSHPPDAPPASQGTKHADGDDEQGASPLSEPKSQEGDTSGVRSKSKQSPNASRGALKQPSQRGLLKLPSQKGAKLPGLKSPILLLNLPLLLPALAIGLFIMIIFLGVVIGMNQTDETLIEEQRQFIPTVRVNTRPCEEVEAESGGESGGESNENMDSAGKLTIGAGDVDKWAEKIDKFLEGRPLHGHGKQFAQAAVKYNIDVRLSAAISVTESGGGQIPWYKYGQYDAWGWAAALPEFSESWDAAIDAHAKGMAEGYDGRLSHEGAAKYCPPGDEWYETVHGYMEDIGSDISSGVSTGGTSSTGTSVSSSSTTGATTSAGSALAAAAVALAGTGHSGPTTNTAPPGPHDSSRNSAKVAPKEDEPGGDWHVWLALKDKLKVSNHACCDCAVAAAVRWSGVDDEYGIIDENGNYQFGWTSVNGCYKYLVNSPKWDRVGPAGTYWHVERNENGGHGDEGVDVQPGDILIRKVTDEANGNWSGSSHIKMFVGTEACNLKYPGQNYMYYEASHSKYWTYLNDGKGNDGEYVVFRRNNTDLDIANSKFAGLLAEEKAKYQTGATTAASVDLTDACGECNDEQQVSSSETNLTEAQRKVQDYAKNPRDGIRIETNMCQQFVDDVFRAAGIDTGRFCCAHKAMDSCKNHTDFDNIPVGACVYASKSDPGADGNPVMDTCGRDAGHIAIYVGDGQVAENVGSHQLRPLKEWVAAWGPDGVGGTVAWGWLGDKALTDVSASESEASNSSSNVTCPAPESESSGPITAYHTVFAGSGGNSNVFWAVVPQGHVPKLAFSSTGPKEASEFAKEQGLALATNFITNNSKEGHLFSKEKGKDTISGKTPGPKELIYVNSENWWTRYTDSGPADMKKLGASIGGFNTGWNVVAENGEMIDWGGGELNPRTFIGQKTTGEFFSCVADGSRDDCSDPGFNMEDEYNFVVKYICGGDKSQLKLLYNCDGGGSSCFVVDGEVKNKAYDLRGRKYLLYYDADSVDYKEWSE